jgi:hypothetical protein
MVTGSVTVTLTTALTQSLTRHSIDAGKPEIGSSRNRTLDADVIRQNTNSVQTEGTKMSRVQTLLITTATAATVALTFACSASAQSIELVQESTGVHCPAVTSPTSGGCEGTAVGQARMEAFGSLVSACDLHLGGRMDEDGHGYVDDIVLTGPSCTTPPCTQGGQVVPWEIELGEPAPGQLEGEARFCIESSVLGTINCHVSSIGFSFTEHGRYEDFDAAPCEDPLSFIHLSGEGSTGDLDGEVIHT